jgi:hypothetical protein
MGGYRFPKPLPLGLNQDFVKFSSGISNFVAQKSFAAFSSAVGHK